MPGAEKKRRRAVNTLVCRKRFGPASSRPAEASPRMQRLKPVLPHHSRESPSAYSGARCSLQLDGHLNVRPRYLLWTFRNPITRSLAYYEKGTVMLPRPSY
jgi:hypothetical protein